jgi:hypothetical protein
MSRARSGYQVLAKVDVVGYELVIAERDKLRAMNEGLIGRLAAIGEAFANCVNKMGVRCPHCGKQYEVGNAETD